MPCPSCHVFPSKIFQIRHHKKISEDMKRPLNCHVDNDFTGKKNTSASTSGSSLSPQFRHSLCQSYQFCQETHRILDHRTLSIKFHRISPMPWRIIWRDAAYSAVPDPKAFSLLVMASQYQFITRPLTQLSILVFPTPIYSSHHKQRWWELSAEITMGRKEGQRMSGTSPFLFTN